MKSERRHELKSNTLAEGLEGLPDWWRKYGSRLLMGVIVVALVVVLAYQWSAGKRQQEAAAKADLATARYAIDQLHQLSLQVARPGGEDQAATLRRQNADDARQAIQLARKNSKDDLLQAEATVALGDLNWLLANMPPLPGATTRESLRLPQPASDYLDEAAAAYQEVIQKYPNQHLSLISAYFGLGAIAENRKDWAAAKADYEKIKSLPGVRSAFQETADQRLTLLAKIEQPVFLATPATLPATTAPTTAAASPATAIAIPTTPATGPTTRSK
jgi:tetratricopeptide (TPR) repeat protein